MAEMPSMTDLASNISPRDSLLTTKLYIPHPRSDRVLRPRLIARLNDALCGGYKLTLISAPAGFGKTTLLGEWSRGSAWPVAWLSLDKSDNDSARFLTYFIAALQTIWTDLGQTALAALHSPQPPAMESVLTALINEISSQPDNFVLILDDYHLINAQPTHTALTFLLDHLPPTMHLVIASRADPPLPLARLRIRGELTELRAADLRFRPDEVAAFFNQVIGLTLSPENVAALEARTEGWIAGLQVAALSMQGRDPEHLADFIQTFTGSHRYLLDYLAEEVLHQQPENIQTFLLQTAILDRLSGPLCEIVTGQVNSQTTLERLERANLFLVPLDDQRQWYRYHHLFADFLRSRLQQVQPDLVPELHRRAAEWYEQHGQLLEAIGHALAVPDFERAGRLVEQMAPTMFARREITTVLRWLEALPEAQVRARPQLSLAYAWVLVAGGQLDAVEPRLRDAESHFGFSILDFGPETEATIQNPKSEIQNREARGQIAAIRSMVACFRGEVAQAVRLSRQALDDLPQNALYLRSTMAVNIALNLLASADSNMDVAEASQVLAEAATASQTSGDMHTALLTLTFLAETEVARGQLHQAAQTFDQVLDMAGHFAAQNEQSLPVASAAHIGLGELLYEWNDLDAAAAQLRIGIELSEREEDRGTWSIGYIPLAHLYQAQGAPDMALKMIQRAEQVARKSNITWLKTRVAAHRVRLWLRQANSAAAVAWAERCGLRIGADIGYRREGEYATLARVWMAQGKVDQALNLLAWLLDVTEAANLTRSVVEILILQALALQGQGNPTAAIIALEQAVALAEPEGYIRTFVDEGAPMAHLLRQAAARGITPDYVSRLLAAFAEATDTAPALPQLLVEPLTERELEVLELITAGMTNQEIAQALTITLGTVKRHLHNIYGKLDVRHRTQAVARARELNLWPE